MACVYTVADWCLSKSCPWQSWKDMVQVTLNEAYAIWSFMWNLLRADLLQRTCLMVSTKLPVTILQVLIHWLLQIFYFFFFLSTNLQLSHYSHRKVSYRILLWSTKTREHFPAEILKGKKKHTYHGHKISFISYSGINLIFFLLLEYNKNIQFAAKSLIQEFPVWMVHLSEAYIAGNKIWRTA